jgi:hypothetical protein
MALPTDFKITSFLPPCLVNVLGKTYACPGWHEVPEGTTLDEVYERWTQDIPKGEIKPEYQISEEVKSSKGEKTYLVTFNGSAWNCSCVGFGFYRDCKHIKEIKIKHKL